MENGEKLQILYEDTHIVAINKPHGLLMHKSSIAKDATEFVLQKLRNQIEKRVYLVHRLDRKTSGAVIFGLNKKVQSHISQKFRERKVKKKYLALVRGYAQDQMTIDYPLKNEKGVYQKAKTEITNLRKFEINVPFGKHDTSRYSLVEAIPETGRMHQIRKHLAHIRHPIIGDRPHGCNKQNRLWKTKWDMNTMLLHSYQIELQHPMSEQQLVIVASISTEFKRVMDILDEIT